MRYWFVVRVTVLAICAAGAGRSAEGLVARWSFDEFANGRTPGLRGKDDALVVRSAQRVKGVSGSALALDGKRSSARCLSISPLAPRDTLTIEAWVRLNPSSLRGFRTVVRKEGCYSLRFQDKTLGLVLWQNGKPRVFSAKRRTWPSNEWFQIAATYDGRRVRLFFNGVADREAGSACSGRIDGLPTELFVGSQGRSAVLKGAIDNVSIYKRALEPKSVLGNYCVGTAVMRAQADVTIAPKPVGLQPREFRKPPREITMVKDGFLWIDAEDFTDYGGWWLDTQYVHLMGSAYLIAAGIGKPVDDAVVKFNVPKAGRYSVWVRARNWLPDAVPGRFELVINGAALDRELGTARTDEWTWEKAGVAALDAGSATMALNDLTGYYGRCDAIVLTTDTGYRPPEDVKAVQRERARLTGLSLEPRHAGDFDVVVVGGGPAGGPAAIAAARMGMKTALIQDRPVLGGNGSDELGVGFNGASAHHPRARETGIIEELGRIKARYHHARFSEAFRMLCEQEENLTVFLNTRIVSVDMASPQRIRHAVGIDTLRGNITTYGGRIFIDCTGDGWVGVFAGAEHRFGREAAGEFDESLAPEKPDRITMSGCLMKQCCGYRAVNTGKPVSYTPPGWAPRFNDPETFCRTPRGISSGNWWMEHPGTFDDMRDGERARDELIRITFGYWDYIKNVWPRRAEARDYALDVVPITVGRREGCRLVGDYIFTQNDAQAGRVFPDRISYGGWGLDVHHPQGIYSGKEGPFDCNPSVPIYTIPYRCLYSKNIANLFMAGRCMSVTHIGLGTVRVQSTLATCGQAAGTAAGMCLARGISPRALGQRHIGELQQQLLKMDQSIPGVRNRDATDLALKATATASSEMTQSHFRRANVRSTDGYELTTSRAMSIPTPPAGRVDSVFVLLESRLAKPKSLTMGLREGKTGADFSAATDAASATAIVHGRGRQWVEFRFKQRVSSPYVWVWLPPAEGIHWTLMSHAPRGSHRAYGLKQGGGVTHANAAQFMSLYTEPTTGDTSLNKASGVNNGLIRLDDENSNMWASDPGESLPQWIELAWPSPATLNSVYLTFDTDLNARRHDAALVPQCVRDYDVAVRANGEWHVIASAVENFQRRRVHRFNPVETDCLRVIVKATNGDASARIYEIRAYNE